MRPLVLGLVALSLAGVARAGPPVRLTTFRDANGNVAYVARFDRRETQLAFYPGTGYGAAGVPSEVPVGERWRLLATFNGGFKPDAGAGGFSVDGRTPIALRQGLGTVVASRDGSVDVRTWAGGATPARWVAFARQNLPLLVDGGRPSPSVATAYWGSVLGGGAATWRTGIGVDAAGDVIYAAAGGQTAASFADVLVRAGAVRAIELDINPEWPTLIAYAHRHGLRPAPFVPNPQQPAGRYLVPDARDFFAVYRRVPGPAPVPLG